VALSGRRIRPRLGRGRPLQPQQGLTARAVSPHQWSRGRRPRPGLGSGRPRRPRRGLVVSAPSSTALGFSSTTDFVDDRRDLPRPRYVDTQLKQYAFISCVQFHHVPDSPSLSGTTRTSGREPAFPGGDIMLLSESSELFFSQLLGLLLPVTNCCSETAVLLDFK